MSMENYTAKKDEIFAFKNQEAETDLKWNSLVSLNRKGGSACGSDGWKGREDKVWSESVEGNEGGGLSRNSFNWRGEVRSIVSEDETINEEDDVF